MTDIHTMTRQELEDWYTLQEQVVNGWHMSKRDLHTLRQLNHVVMEAAHKIHNDTMLEM